MNPLSNQKNIQNSNAPSDSNQIQEQKKVNNDHLLKLKAKIAEVCGSKIYYNEALNSALWKQKVLSGEKKLLISDEKALLLSARTLYMESSPVKRQFNQILDKVENEILSGLIINEEELMNKYDLENIIKNCSSSEKIKLRKEFQRFINTTYIDRILKQKGKIVNLEINESKLLSALVPQNKIASYDKETVYARASEEIELLKKDEFFLLEPLEIVMKSVDYCCLKARLSNFEITDDVQINKFQYLKEKYNFWKDRLKQKSEYVPLNLPDSFSKFSLPYNQKKYLENSFKTRKENLINGLLLKGFKDIKNEFLSNTSVDDFNAIIDNKVDSFINSNLDELEIRCKRLYSENGKTLKNKIEFFEKWGPYVIKEFEVLKSNEILETGICWALCENFMRHTLNKNNISVTDLDKVIGVTSKNRYEQALLLLGSKKSKDFIKGKLLSKSIVKKYGVHEEAHSVISISSKYKSLLDSLLSTQISLREDIDINEINDIIDYNQELNKLMTLSVSHSDTARKTILNDNQNIAKLCVDELNTLERKDSNGWCLFDIYGAIGHGIVICLNPKNGEAAIMDPNIGLINLSGNNFKESQENLEKCLQDLIEVFYPDTFLIKIVKSQKTPSFKENQL